VTRPVAPDTELLKQLPGYLARQRWYGGVDEPGAVEAVDLADGAFDLPDVAHFAVDADGSRYQLLVGSRPLGEAAEFLRGHENAVIGEVGERFYYDAVVDPDLMLALLPQLAPDAEPVERVRPAGVEQSNSSLVYDDCVIVKLFRRLSPGPNPDAEVPPRLLDVGFTHVARQLGRRRAEGLDFDLAVAQEFLAGATEGWALALTSLRDLFGLRDTQRVPVISNIEEPPEMLSGPTSAGGDFSGEARRLGEVTAELHVAMGEAFGRRSGDAGAWADAMEARLASVRAPDLDRDAAAAVFAGLRGIADPGPAIRVHGDYHLGQVMRTDAGWYVLDFEGEPARPLEERTRPTSAMKDVAGMLRSLHYASRVAMADRGGSEAELFADDAAEWEAVNRSAFLDGYTGVADAAGLLPADPAARRVVLAAFELDKAIYEVAYELAHRPDWVGIPLEAVRRLTEAG
jgi:maltokinase